MSDEAFAPGREWRYAFPPELAARIKQLTPGEVRLKAALEQNDLKALRYLRNVCDSQVDGDVRGELNALCEQLNDDFKKMYDQHLRDRRVRASN